MDRWLDVDFRKDTHFVPGDTTPDECRAFGGGLVFGSEFPAYEDVAATIPKSEWPDYIAKMDADGGGADRLVCVIYNQGNEGSCVANACSQANEIIQSTQLGKDRSVRLSAISLYKRIGSSANSGAFVSDGLKEMQTRGILPLDTPENRARFGDKVMPATGFRTKYPADWEATAKLFCGTEASVVRTTEGLITALLNHHPVVVGRAGHSICYVRPMYRKGSLVVKYANSWGNWGDGGYGYDSMGNITSSARWAFALRSVIVPEVA